MDQKNKVLYSTDKFDVLEKDGKVGIEPNALTVAVLPFTRDGRGLPGQLGVLKEYNRIRSKEAVTVITGKADGEDPDILTAAQRKLMERSGLDVQEPERWYFLGFMTTHKMVNQEIPCFACDITGLSAKDADEDIEDVDPDAADVDSKPEFMLMNVNQALESDDCFIPTIFMKVFKFIFGFSSGDEDTHKKNPGHDNKKNEILNIEGVTGASNIDDEWIIHTKKDTDDIAIKSRVAEIVGDDIIIKIEEIPDENTEIE